MLRVSFSSMKTARAAASVFETYGYRAKHIGREVVTDCPTLLAVPAIQKRVGLSEVERFELAEMARVSTGELPATIPDHSATGSEMRA